MRDKIIRKSMQKAVPKRGVQINSVPYPLLNKKTKKHPGLNHIMGPNAVRQ